jgi:D-alanine--poly(phosphoribitol) ligase subunit 1
VNLLRRIDHAAAAAPEAIAHVSGDRSPTYGELHRHSNGLASYLTKRFGVIRRPFAVLGHREPEMLIAFLGAVNSGRRYVPIDTELPQTRLPRKFVFLDTFPVTANGKVDRAALARSL